MALVRVVQVVIAIIAVVDLGACLYPPAADMIVGLPTVVLGGTAPCTHIEAASGLWGHVRVPHGSERIASSMRLENDSGGYHLWNTSRGRFWIEADSDAVLPFLLSQQERQIYGNIRTGDVVLDCGAHVGVYTREALRAGAALVVAIEPAPDNVECLRRNFDREIRTGRVIVYPKGVWDNEDSLTLHTVQGNSAGDTFVFHGGGKEVTVPLTTIDRIIAELQLPNPVTLIKMDIKGAERRALIGAAHTISTQRPRLAIASEHLPDDPEKISAIVWGFRPDYRRRCGFCFKRGAQIRPEVLFFE